MVFPRQTEALEFTSIPGLATSSPLSVWAASDSLTGGVGMRSVSVNREGKHMVTRGGCTLAFTVESFILGELSGSSVALASAL